VKQGARMSEVRMKVACFLAEHCHATSGSAIKDASFILTSDILPDSFILRLTVNTIIISYWKERREIYWKIINRSGFTVEKGRWIEINKISEGNAKQIAKGSIHTWLRGAPLSHAPFVFLMGCVSRIPQEHVLSSAFLRQKSLFCGEKNKGEVYQI